MKSLKIIVAAALVASMLVGCCSTSDDKAIYNFSSEADVTSLDSSVSDDGVSFNAIHAFSEGLMDITAKGGTKLVPAAASSYKLSDDGLTYTITLKKGVNNVKRFVTKVAAAGVYERVRLDRDYVDVETYAHGGAIYQTLEGFLSGRESISDLLNIFVKELENAAYEDLTVALQSTMVTMPAANKHTSGGFVATEFDRILNTVRAYGQPTIFATMAFASSIIPEDETV